MSHSGWNQGFFGGDESMGETVRIVNNARLQNDDDNLVREGEAEVYKVTEESAHSLLHNLNGKTSQDSGWNVGFFDGDEIMAEKERINWYHHQDVGNENLVGQDLKANIDGSEWDRQNKAADDAYKARQDKLAADALELRNSLMFTEQEFSSFSGKNKEFVDADNYSKFLNMRKESDFLNVYFEVFIITIYTLLLILLLILKYCFGVLDAPLLSLMLIPILIMTLYNSLNSFSFIKISL